MTDLEKEALEIYNRGKKENLTTLFDTDVRTWEYIIYNTSVKKALEFEASFEAARVVMSSNETWKNFWKRSFPGIVKDVGEELPIWITSKGGDESPAFFSSLQEPVSLPWKRYYYWTVYFCRQMFRVIQKNLQNLGPGIVEAGGQQFFQEEQDGRTVTPSITITYVDFTLSPFQGIRFTEEGVRPETYLFKFRKGITLVGKDNSMTVGDVIDGAMTEDEGSSDLAKAILGDDPTYGFPMCFYFCAVWEDRLPYIPASTLSYLAWYYNKCGQILVDDVGEYHYAAIYQEDPDLHIQRFIDAAAQNAPTILPDLPTKNGGKTIYLGSCIACGVHEAKAQCKKCKKAYYCGKKCQVAHWETHKTACLH